MELMNSGQGVATYWDAIYLEILRSRDLFDTQALLQPDNCPSTIVLVTARRQHTASIDTRKMHTPPPRAPPSVLNINGLRPPS